jgi:hypothetical protein
MTEDRKAAISESEKGRSRIKAEEEKAWMM